MSIKFKGFKGSFVQKAFILRPLQDKSGFYSLDVNNLTRCISLMDEYKKTLSFTIAIFMILLSFTSVAPLKGQKLTREDYINTYKELAIKEMKRSGIPASITLAQGMLESGNGNSTLAVKGNNHFGIKCHGWKGKKIYHDDDAKGECFRKYKSAYESYIDHSEFLMHTPRYRFLFDLDPDDYKGWAKGLKKAGYATSPRYATMLIKIIEDNELYVYDSGNARVKRKRERNDKAQSESDFSVSVDRRVKERNRVEYIEVKKGDTFESLQEEFDLLPFELFSYNNLPKGAGLYPGQELYLQPKRNRAERGNDIHVVQEGETMYSISQKYAVKLNKLYKRNHMDPADELQPGETIWLRKRKPVKK